MDPVFSNLDPLHPIIHPQEAVQVSEFYFKADGQKSQWVADGELLGVSDIHIEAVHNLVHVFGSRPMRPKTVPKRRATVAAV